MNSFSQRQKAFETKFSRDEELQFRTTARRNRMLGLWAAEIMGVGPEQAGTYAQEVIMSFFECPEEGHIIKKILKDFQDAGLDVNVRKIAKELEKLHQQAHDSVFKDEKE